MPRSAWPQSRHLRHRFHEGNSVPLLPGSGVLGGHVRRCRATRRRSLQFEVNSQGSDEEVKVCQKWKVCQQGLLSQHCIGSAEREKYGKGRWKVRLAATKPLITALNPADDPHAQRLCLRADTWDPLTHMLQCTAGDG